MTRTGIYSLCAFFLVVLSGGRALAADSQKPALNFQEVYDLVRAHLEGVDEAELNSIAARALISALSPKVSLDGVATAPADLTETALIPKSSFFEGGIAYVRIARVGEGLAKAVHDACERSIGTNKLNGVVLDLRYAGGKQYAEAAATADLFVRKERPLLDWGHGMVRSKEKTDAIGAPVAVLVNRETTRAAEALAAVMRETGAGLVLGRPTAGEAMIAEEYPLKNGERLRIATAPIRLGNDAALSAEGVKPDIVVQVAPQDERAYYADAFKEVVGTTLIVTSAASTNQLNGTNRIRRPRFNEAELVRERREGFNPDLELSADRGREPETPVVRDPALARALDVLKGLAVVRQSRS
jgi:hypothetical protein